MIAPERAPNRGLLTSRNTKHKALLRLASIGVMLMLSATLNTGAGRERANPMQPGDQDRRVTSEGERRANEAFERGYSTAPVEISLEGHEYRIPMNYITPFGKYPAVSTPHYVNVFMFLPDFRGYDQENFRDPFDERKITVFWGGAFGGAPAERQFANAQKNLGVEKEPHDKRYGLAVYRREGVAYESWLVGDRNDGGVILLKCKTYSPENAVLNPLCEVRYPHLQNGYGLAYRFRANHLAQWREIDERVNKTIMSWRTR